MTGLGARAREHRLRHFTEGPTARGKRRFTKKFVEIHGGMGFLRVGLVRFIFGP